MSKKALVVGINTYRNYNDLDNAANDAEVIGQLFKENEPQRPERLAGGNYKTTILSSKELNITRQILLDEISNLFQSNQDHLLFYFAGHAARSQDLIGNYLVTWDGDNSAPGIPMQTILEYAKNAVAEGRSKSCTILLDCCHAAAINEEFGGVLNKGITILTASGANQLARDSGGRENHGAFTSLLLDGLEGQAADLLGRVTPASLYALVDARMGGAAQRPMFKTHVNEFIVLRKCRPTIELEHIECLVKPIECLDNKPPFLKATSKFRLSPEFEKNRDKNFEKCFGENSHPFNEEKHEVFRKLQECFRNGMIKVIKPKEKPEHWDCMTKLDSGVGPDEWPPESSGAFSMWHAAIYSAEIQLNHVGRHYWKLAKEGRLEEG